MRHNRVGVLTSVAVGLLVSSAGICIPDGQKEPIPATPAPSGRILTLDDVTKLLKAEQNLIKVQSRDVNMDISMAVNGTPDTFQSWVARLESSPEAVEALRSAGMSPKEYLRTYVAVIQASAVSGAKKQGKEVPARLKDQVPQANVAFVEAHAKEIGRIANPAPASVKPNTMEDIYAASDAPKEDGKAPAKAEAAAAAPSPDPKTAAPKNATKKP